MLRNKKVRGYILGADPGQKGFIALLAVDGSLERLDDSHHVLIKIPTVADKTGGSSRRQVDEYGLIQALEPYGNRILAAYVEKQGGRPGSSTQGVFKLGDNYGKLKTAICAVRYMEGNQADHHYEEIIPQTWQAEVRSVFEKATELRDKDLSMYAAKAYFPDLAGFFDDDNAAEAFLIAYAGYLRYKKDAL